MLKKIHLCMNHARRVKRCKQPRFSSGINLLIGPNGSGKSTILRAIMDCADCRRIEEGETEYNLFDAERMNPRASGETVGYTNMLLRARAQFSSHGQILQDVFRTIRFSSSTCLLLDEPESGQDFEHILLLRSLMARAAEKGAQIICATHHPLFWHDAHYLELKSRYRERVTHALCKITCPATHGEPDEN